MIILTSLIKQRTFIFNMHHQGWCANINNYNRQLMFSRFRHDTVLARNFKTCVRDSLLGTIWRPRMKNMRTGIRI